MEETSQTPDFVFEIQHQEQYSRGQLLLRSFFGWLYIAIPHAFVLFFMQIAAGILQFLAWWIVLFTAQYPKSFFDFQMAIQRWGARVNASLFNLIDNYPAFGLNAEDPNVTLTLVYPQTLSRGILLLRTFLGIFYVLIPHGFILFFRMFLVYIYMFFGWWIVLFTGKYPKGMHEFIVDTLRWSTRVGLYMLFLTDKYPSFSGK
ncbi:MAG: DUF4389 domain-containing protein [Bacteroidia bacterium]|jgi:hypothetical protein|nr:DUF4389 domain-containing protein [Bacteroidia bacterium]